MVRGCHLSDDELAVFGVKRSRDRWGNRDYIIHCDVCGETMRTRKYNTNNVYKCKLCTEKDAKAKDELKKLRKEAIEREESKQEGIDYTHYHRFESAVEKLEPKYYLSILQAEKVKDKFDSVPEVLACVELLYIGARVIPHQKVGDFTVDFCLPDEKVVIEIDGELYHSNKDKEYRRDYALKNMLGSDWVVKHIPAETLKKNHALFGKNIKKLLDDRRFELNIR